MLSQLKIENVAVIEHAEIVFDHGLNILTGETGAGKSIVIDSINAILGERTSKDIIRNGCDKARVTAFFENIPGSILPVLEDYDVDCDDNSLLITRIISSDGRGSCKINGRPVTVSMLKDIGRNLITICGQHDSQFLLLKEHHLSFVDMIADDSNLEEELMMHLDAEEVWNHLKKKRQVIQKVFMLYFYFEMTHKEIAEELFITENTVKKHTSHIFNF